MMIKEKVLHKVYTSHKDVISPKRVYRSLIKQAVIMTLQEQHVNVPCVVNVLITNGKVIRKYNSEYRGIDKSTDVLSFPMQVFDGAGWENISALEIDEDTGLLPLGDIVMSIEHIRRQARTYGHSVEHETSYLTIHSTLHLLGFDHIDEQDKRQMRDLEKFIVKNMGYFNDN